MTMFINYCQKCGQVMECVIVYQCGLPKIKYFCPHHGSAIEYQVTYSTSTSPGDSRSLYDFKDQEKHLYK